MAVAASKPSAMRSCVCNSRSAKPRVERIWCKQQGLFLHLIMR